MNWLLRSVTQAVCLHDLLWWFVSALTPMDEEEEEEEEEEAKDGQKNEANGKEKKEIKKDQEVRI